MNISRENENGVEKRRMQLINKNLNDIYFYFNNFDVVCGSASEVSRYFPPDNRATAGTGIIAVLQRYEIKSEELSGSVS
ncbi:hypothetical protein MLA66_003396 [Salmonella enterica]|nr:hypothetical protein [Salmonella enterica]EEM7109598.1 hypothetical protein [Salmonella enterica subsp. enterica serovar Poona]EEH1291509.1 hypothetical protein [Salmonella enterica]EEO3564434.1 hypothetical protein [Salmonella enterica subsp. enterica serovar Poona]EHZ8148665.1 hypothetical protein [Salmonella enterica]